MKKVIILMFMLITTISIYSQNNIEYKLDSLKMELELSKMELKLSNFYNDVRFFAVDCKTFNLELRIMSLEKENTFFIYEEEMKAINGLYRGYKEHYNTLKNSWEQLKIFSFFSKNYEDIIESEFSMIDTVFNCMFLKISELDNLPKRKLNNGL